MSNFSKTNGVIAIILARGGSKGLPGKNLSMLAGKPLICYTIEAARQAKTVDRIIVSTDDCEIEKVCKEYGAEVPFLRPYDLATDDATSEDALLHAVNWLDKNQNYRPDIVVYLQVTDLFRNPSMIDDCVNILRNRPEIDSAFMGHIEHKNFWRKSGDKFERLADDIPYGLPRQKREPVYREDTGIALATRTHVILEGKRLGENCHIIPYYSDANFIDIHKAFDLWLSEMLIREQGIIPNQMETKNV